MATRAGVILSQGPAGETMMKAGYAALGVGMLFVGLIVGLFIALKPA
jgi:hypothetical protein